MRDRGQHLKKLDRLLESSHGAPVDPLRSCARNGDVAEQLVSLLAPDSFEADQYRSLRLAVERLRRESGLQVLAMSSPTPGDGKTVTTVNLAGALAQNPDSRVLVIDGDLRRPSVAKYLGLDRESSPGLADALVDSACSLRHVVRRLNGFNLSVVPAGSPHSAPYELLNSVRLEHLLREARELYDCVLIDTPPLVPVPDCRLIGKWVDGFLLIVGANKTPRKLVADALNLLDPAKVIGIVFNGDKRPLSNRYGYYQYYTHTKDTDSSWWRRMMGPRRHGVR